MPKHGPANAETRLEPIDLTYLQTSGPGLYFGMLSRTCLRILRQLPALSVPTISARTISHPFHSSCILLEGTSRGGGAGLTNILAGEVPPPVQVKTVTQSGITLQDGLILRSACIFLEGKVFLWDVPLKRGSEAGSLWRGWGKERFELFEVVVPKPGEYGWFGIERLSSHFATSYNRDIDTRNGKVCLAATTRAQEASE